MTTVVTDAGNAGTVVLAAVEGALCPQAVETGVVGVQAGATAINWYQTVEPTG